MDVSHLSTRELLDLYSSIPKELYERGILRTENVVGDLAEYLFSQAFGWMLARNSTAGYDAIDSDGWRYQIKGRRPTLKNPSRELSALRALSDVHFDYLAGVLFAENYEVVRAAIIPYAIVLEQAKEASGKSHHKFFLHDRIWQISGVRDVTESLRAVPLSGPDNIA
jgi:hypothetical protein